MPTPNELLEERLGDLQNELKRVQDVVDNLRDQRDKTIIRRTDITQEITALQQAIAKLKAP